MSKNHIRFRSLAFKGLPEHFVSSDGYFWSTKGGRWRKLKLHIQSNGYYASTLSHNSKYRPYHVHRLVLEAFVGPCPEGMESCHNDGNKNNNNINNLRWDSRKNNHRDKIQHGTHLYGENHGMAILVEKEVLDIRKLSDAGVSPIDISKQYPSVSYPTIYAIIKRSIWKHL